VLDVIADRLLGELQASRDIVIGLSPCDQTQHFHLPGGKAVRPLPAPADAMSSGLENGIDCAAVEPPFLHLGTQLLRRLNGHERRSVRTRFDESAIDIRSTQDARRQR
jgi:hypothetical protein